MHPFNFSCHLLFRQGFLPGYSKTKTTMMVKDNVYKIAFGSILCLRGLQFLAMKFQRMVRLTCLSVFHYQVPREEEEKKDNKVILCLRHR